MHANNNIRVWLATELPDMERRRQIAARPSSAHRGSQRPGIAMIGRPGSAVSPYGEATGTANKSYSPKSFGDGDGRVPADRELLHEAVRHRLNNLRSKVRLV